MAHVPILPAWQKDTLRSYQQEDYHTQAEGAVNAIEVFCTPQRASCSLRCTRVLYRLSCPSILCCYAGTLLSHQAPRQAEQHPQQVTCSEQKQLPSSLPHTSMLSYLLRSASP